MTKQPEALRLADMLMFSRHHEDHQAAAELRRLHAETTNQQDWLVEWRKCEDELKRMHEVNQELLEALQRIKHHFDTDEYAWRIAEAAITKAGEQP